MKHLLFSFFIFISVVLNAQTLSLPTDSATGRVTFKEAVNIYNTSQSELFTRAYEWIDFYFKSDKEYISVNDKVTGKLTSALHFDVTIPMRDTLNANNETIHVKKTDVGYWRFSFIFEAKDGRYKLILTDFIHSEKVFSNLKQTYNEIALGGKIENENALNGKYPNKTWLEFKQQVETRTKKLMVNLQNYIVDHKFKEPSW